MLPFFSIIPVLYTQFENKKILIAKEEETQLSRDIKHAIMNDLDVQYSNSGIPKLLHMLPSWIHDSKLTIATKRK